MSSRLHSKWNPHMESNKIKNPIDGIPWIRYTRTELGLRRSKLVTKCL